MDDKNKRWGIRNSAENGDLPTAKTVFWMLDVLEWYENELKLRAGKAALAQDRVKELEKRIKKKDEKLLEINREQKVYRLTKEGLDI